MREWLARRSTESPDGTLLLCAAAAAVESQAVPVLGRLLACAGLPGAVPWVVGPGASRLQAASGGLTGPGTKGAYQRVRLWLGPAESVPSRLACVVGWVASASDPGVSAARVRECVGAFSDLAGEVGRGASGRTTSCWGLAKLYHRARLRGQGVS